jgi:hypothetical protein
MARSPPTRNCNIGGREGNNLLAAIVPTRSKQPAESSHPKEANPASLDLRRQPEGCLFSNISANWRGRPLTGLVTIVSLIASTRTKTGLRVRAAIDRGEYPTGIKVSPGEIARVRLRKRAFHWDWNYTILPRGRRR